MLCRSARRLRFCLLTAVAVFGIAITFLLGFGGTPAAAQVTGASGCISAIQQAIASGTTTTCNPGSGPVNISCSTDRTTTCTFTGACTGSITTNPRTGEIINDTTCLGGGTVITGSGPFATTASALLF